MELLLAKISESGRGRMLFECRGVGLNVNYGTYFKWKIVLSKLRSWLKTAIRYDNLCILKKNTCISDYVNFTTGL